MNRYEFFKTQYRPGKILDVGNLEKSGKLHRALIERYPESEWYGLDPVEQSTVGASFKNQFVGSLEKMPFEDGQFDTVYLGQVIEHVWNPKGALDEVHRVLKRGGRVVLDTPSLYSFTRYMRYLVRGREDFHTHPEHKFGFTPAILKEVLQAAGFTEVKIVIEHNMVFKGHMWFMPEIWPFKLVGEGLCAVGTKP